MIVWLFKGATYTTGIIVLNAIWP